MKRRPWELYRDVAAAKPEYVKRFKPRMDQIMARWADSVGDGLQFETDFSSNSSIYRSDVLVTDWSGIAYEYSYTTLRPTLFVNTKMKVSRISTSSPATTLPFTPAKPLVPSPPVLSSTPPSLKMSTSTAAPKRAPRH